MKKIILDIGSHKLEEINLFFIKDLNIILFYLNWWLRYFYFITKKILSFKKKDNIILNYSFTKWPIELSFVEHKNLLFHLFKNENFNNFNLIVVEPNIDISFRNIQKFKKKINLTFFPFILSNLLKDKTISFSNFYVGENSLSSSIYKKKTNDLAERTLTINITSFIEILKNEGLLNESKEIILRINCEGEEFEIIKELLRNKIKINAILGSLYDVKKIHGDEVYNDMLETLNENEINYVHFKASDPSTWLNAISTLSKYLRNV